MTLAEFGDAVDNARGYGKKVFISMNLGSCHFGVEIEDIDDDRKRLHIRLTPFTKEELEALLAEYKEG